MSLTSLSAFCAFPSAARISASSKEFAAVSIRAKPRKVPPPQAVPPTRTKSPGDAESTRRMDTPVPMMTRIIGNNGSGHGFETVTPSSLMVKMSCSVPSPLLPPVPSVPIRQRGGARSRRPSTIADISVTGSNSTRRASRKRGANLQAPPPAVAMRRCGRSDVVKRSSDQLEKVRVNLAGSSVSDSSDSSLPIGSESRLSKSPQRRRRSPKCSTAISSWDVDPEMKRNTKVLPCARIDISKWFWVRPLLPKLSGNRYSAASFSGNASTIFTSVPPMSQPMCPGASRIFCRADNTDEHVLLRLRTSDFLGSGLLCSACGPFRPIS
mmetsp:Transcript_7933/g.14423  ORF Transcript_7933/g.14423 Transcript_7933/m.14423 type:complete len:324 (-) Transcript_7933:117-1088(-)